MKAARKKNKLNTGKKRGEKNPIDKILAEINSCQPTGHVTGLPEIMEQNVPKGNDGGEDGAAAYVWNEDILYRGIPWPPPKPEPKPEPRKYTPPVPPNDDLSWATFSSFSSSVPLHPTRRFFKIAEQKRRKRAARKAAKATERSNIDNDEVTSRPFMS